MADQIDEFIADSRKLIGQNVAESPMVNNPLNRREAQHFARALGSNRRVWNDADYASVSRYRCLLAPQTVLASVRPPCAEGAYSQKDYGLTKLYTGADFEWFDVIRITDSFTTELKLKEVYEGQYGTKRAVYVVAEGKYWNQHQECVGTGRGTVCMIPLERGTEMLLDRGMHVYSEEQVKHIEDDLDREVDRGMATLYWEEVAKGDVLTPVVKGPVGLSEIMSWREVAHNVDYCLEVMYSRAVKAVGNRCVNPTTNWPYWHEDQNWDDYFSCKAGGLPLPWMHGLHRVCLAEDLLTKWMGDDGFLRKLDLKILKPFLYQDTNWYQGEVTDTYKEEVGGVTYKAVDVKIEVTNQLEEQTAAGSATIYLASRGQEVPLPILQ